MCEDNKKRKMIRRKSKENVFQMDQQEHSTKKKPIHHKEKSRSTVIEILPPSHLPLLPHSPGTQQRWQWTSS